MIIIILYIYMNKSMRGEKNPNTTDIDLSFIFD